MLKEFVKYINSLARPEIVTLEDRRVYATDPCLSPLPPTVGEPLRVSTLTAFSGAAYHEIEVNRETPIIQVQNEGRVLLLSHKDEVWRQRRPLVIAETDSARFQYGEYIPQEEFLIEVLAMFAPTDDQAKVLQYAASILSQNEIGMTDDGVSQKISIKKTLANVQEIRVENPVVLRPYCTFPEVQPPERPFIFRAKKYAEGDVRFALFEAGFDGRWRAEAVSGIREFLSEEGYTKTPGLMILT